ncbi:MAG: crossover junction endodeoxyribonuclease RuvC [Acidobacteriota bacterium]|nr:crossover junction endodeoxyribonuclease RuvC [Acidobacteriota bacterium]
MLILGLDPGSLHTGYGLVERQGSALRAVEAGRISCPRTQAVPSRLAHLSVCLGELLDRCQPDLAVLETPFHGMNSKSLIVLAEARGVLLAVLAGRGLEIREYTPAEVKSAVTGNGRADKDQVAHMVRLLLAAKDPASAGWASDATDALAVALCGAQRLRLDRLRDQVVLS